MKKTVSVLCMVFLILALLTGCTYTENTYNSSGNTIKNTEAPQNLAVEKENSYVDILQENGWRYHYIGESYEEGKPRWFSQTFGDNKYSINIDSSKSFIYFDVNDSSTEWDKLFLIDRGEVYLFATGVNGSLYTTMRWYPEYNIDLIYCDIEYTDNYYNDYHYVSSYNIANGELVKLIYENENLESTISDDALIEMSSVFYDNVITLLSRMDITISALIKESKNP